MSEAENKAHEHQAAAEALIKMVGKEDNSSPLVSGSAAARDGTLKPGPSRQRASQEEQMSKNTASRSSGTNTSSTTERSLKTPADTNGKKWSSVHQKRNVIDLVDDDDEMEEQPQPQPQSHPLNQSAPAPLVTTPSTAGAYLGPEMLATFHFPSKLYEIVCDDSTAPIITWLPDGNSFAILNEKKFKNEILPLLYCFKRGPLMPSFLQDMKQYGFEKVTSPVLQRSIPGVVQFSHDFFLKDKQFLLRKISTRPMPKPRTPPTTSQRTPQRTIRFTDESSAAAVAATATRASMGCISRDLPLTYPPSTLLNQHTTFMRRLNNDSIIESGPRSILRNNPQVAPASLSIPPLMSNPMSDIIQGEQRRFLNQVHSLLNIPTGASAQSPATSTLPASAIHNSIPTTSASRIANSNVIDPPAPSREELFERRILQQQIDLIRDNIAAIDAIQQREQMRNNSTNSFIHQGQHIRDNVTNNTIQHHGDADADLNILLRANARSGGGISSSSNSNVNVSGVNSNLAGFLGRNASAVSERPTATTAAVIAAAVSERSTGTAPATAPTILGNENYDEMKKRIIAEVDHWKRNDEQRQEREMQYRLNNFLQNRRSDFFFTNQEPSAIIAKTEELLQDVQGTCNLIEAQPNADSTMILEAALGVLNRDRQMDLILHEETIRHSRAV